MNTLSAAPPRSVSGGAEASPGPAPATPRFNRIMAASIALLVVVFVLSRWADNHDLVTDADSAPWTLLLLGTALLPGIILVVPLWRARGPGLAVRHALPAGYDLALLGVGVLLGGGILDVLLRTLLPADALSTDVLRPTALIQAAGGVLLASGPLRAVALSRPTSGGRVSWRVLLPALVAATALLITLALLTERFHPLVDPGSFATQPSVRPLVNDIYRMNADGSGQTRLLTRPGHFFWGPAWSPDGKQLVFTMGTDPGPGVLYTAHADGSQATPLTQAGRSSYLPAWSPDGSKIAFLSQALTNGHFGDVAVINADGSSERQLTQTGGWTYGVSWSPDSQKLVFGSRQSGIWQLYTATADGRDPVLLETAGGGNAPAWSPDGKQIAFTSDRTGKDNIYLVDLGSHQVQRLTNGASNNDNAVWSPDGTQIAFGSDRAGHGEIFVMQADGSGATNLTSNPGLDSLVPGWSPGGTQILYTAAGHAAPGLPVASPALGLAAVLIQSALFSGVLLFVARRWRLPVGALALLLVGSSLPALALHDHYEFLPGVILTALAAELLYAGLLPRAGGLLAGRPARWGLFAAVVPGLFTALYLLTVGVTQGLAGTAESALGVVLVASATGLLLSFLVLPLADRVAVPAGATKE